MKHNILKRMNILLVVMAIAISVFPPASANSQYLFEDGRNIIVLPEGQKTFFIKTAKTNLKNTLNFNLDNIRQNYNISDKLGYYECIKCNEQLITLKASLKLQVKNEYKAKLNLICKYDGTRRNIRCATKSGSDIQIAISQKNGFPVLSISPADTPQWKFYLENDLPVGGHNNSFIVYQSVPYPLFQQKGTSYLVKIPKMTPNSDEIKIMINGYKYDCDSLAGGAIAFKKKKLVFVDYNQYSEFLYGYDRKITMEYDPSDHYIFYYYYQKPDCDKGILRIVQELAKEDKESQKCYEKIDNAAYYVRIIKSIINKFGKNFSKNFILISKNADSLKEEIRKDLGEQKTKGIEFKSYESLD
jgi:hypothetical protein